MRPWLDRAVWEAVSSEIRDHRRRGLGALITEDVVRFATVGALVDAGVDASELKLEAPHTALKGSRIDLVVGGQPTALIELKYPREPNLVNAAWTMALGEILKDFYRLSAYPGGVDRIFVYVESSQLRAYMTRSAARYGIDLDSTLVLLSPADAAKLPSTARQIIGIELATHPVTARRISLTTVDNDLRLAIYHVDPLPAPIGPVAEVLDPDAKPEEQPSPATRTGVRREIMRAVRSVLGRSGVDTFSPAEVVSEMKRTGTSYAESTIRTMIASHLCGNAPDNAGTTYNDFIRVDHGRYRLSG